MQLQLMTENKEGAVNDETKAAIAKIDRAKELVHVETQLQIIADLFAKRAGVCTHCKQAIGSPALATYIEVPNYGSRFGGSTRHLVHKAKPCNAAALEALVDVSLRFATRMR